MRSRFQFQYHKRSVATLAIDIDSSDKGLKLSIDTKNRMIFRAIDLPLYCFRFRKFSSDLTEGMSELNRVVANPNLYLLLPEFEVRDP